MELSFLLFLHVPATGVFAGRSGWIFLKDQRGRT
jgi:hypothetical protein